MQEHFVGYVNNAFLFLSVFGHNHAKIFVSKAFIKWAT